MLKIGYFSYLSKISIRMLRHYDQINLLKPQNTDQDTGYRYYSEDQLPLAARITALRDMGFGLTSIQQIMQQYDNPEALAQFLSVKQTELQAEADATKHYCFWKQPLNG